MRYDPRKGIRYTVCLGDRRPKLKMCNSKLILDSYEHLQVARYDPCTHDASTVTLIKVQSRNAFLRVPLACVRSYLKSVSSCRFAILGTYHPDILYLREQRCVDPRLIFEAKRGSASSKVSGNH